MDFEHLNFDKDNYNSTEAFFAAFTGSSFHAEVQNHSVLIKLICNNYLFSAGVDRKQNVLTCQPRAICGWSGPAFFFL